MSNTEKDGSVIADAARGVPATARTESPDRSHSFEPPSTPVRIILDTDMATDCDDAGALAVLHALSAGGEAEILAVVTNNRHGASIGAVAAINAYFDRPNITLGAYQGDVVGTAAAQFVQEIAADTASYGHTVTNRSQVPSAVEVYRQTLAAAPDSSVLIVSIGHLNNLADLLHSGPDAHSPLTGIELVEQKTRHMVAMGGDYPSGFEHNFFARNSAPFAMLAVHNWPVPILFSGYTLGSRIKTGIGLAGLPTIHPVRRAYAGHSSDPLVNGRASWDQTGILAAVRGHAPWWKLSDPGYNRVNADGSNRWQDDPEGPHAYLVQAMSSPSVAREIGQLMQYDP